MNTTTGIKNKLIVKFKPFLLISTIRHLSKTLNFETRTNRISLSFTTLILLICSCTNAEKKPTIANNNAIKTQALNDSNHDDITYYEGESEETDFYVVICDTGTDYYSLRNQMLGMSKSGNFLIDSLNRYYDVEKKELILPEKHEDQMYAGQYYPRRFEGDFISIEYLNQFHAKSNPNTLAIIAGIYSNKSEAEQRKTILKQNGFMANTSNCKLYTGCMH